MKGTQLLLSFWLSTVVFCLLQVIFGPTGWLETVRLHEYRSRLEARLDALQLDNERLNGRYTALASSLDAVRLEARALGYFRPGDVPIRTPGGPGFRLPSSQPDLSLVPRPADHAVATSVFFRLAWPLLFVTWILVFRLWDRLRPAGPRLDVEPVPTAPRPSVPQLPPPLSTGLDFFRK